MAHMTDSIASRIATLREEISAACDRAGRNAQEVTLLAVTKTQPWEYVQAAYDAGLRVFGENRVQEASRKFSEVPPGAELHLVGHLQRNKAREAARLVSAVHSIDKVETAQALSRQLSDSSRSMDILFEINVAGEESKHGVRSGEELWPLIDACLELPGLRARGLMTIAPFTDDETVLRKAFRQMVALRDEARTRYPESTIHELSMGMSNDYTIAAEEGATILRIGTAIFGARGG